MIQQTASESLHAPVLLPPVLLIDALGGQQCSLSSSSSSVFIPTSCALSVPDELTVKSSSNEMKKKLQCVKENISLLIQLCHSLKPG